MKNGTKSAKSAPSTGKDLNKNNVCEPVMNLTNDLKMKQLGTSKISPYIFNQKNFFLRDLYFSHQLYTYEDPD